MSFSLFQHVEYLNKNPNQRIQWHLRRRALGMIRIMLILLEEQGIPEDQGRELAVGLVSLSNQYQLDNVWDVFRDWGEGKLSLPPLLEEHSEIPQRMIEYLAYGGRDELLISDEENSHHEEMATELVEDNFKRLLHVS